MLSMIIAGIIAFITALSFAKLTAWQPVEGGVYEYGRQLVSPYAGFLAGWMWLVANTFTGAAVSLGFAFYLGVSYTGLAHQHHCGGHVFGFHRPKSAGCKRISNCQQRFCGHQTCSFSFFCGLRCLQR